MVQVKSSKDDSSISKNVKGMTNGKARIKKFFKSFIVSTAPIDIFYNVIIIFEFYIMENITVIIKVERIGKSIKIRKESD